MAEEKKRPRGPSEYAREDARPQGPDGEAHPRKRYKPKRKLPFLLKLIGLAVIGFAGWLGYRLAIGKPVDISSAQGRQKALGELGRDMGTAGQAVQPYVKKGLAYSKEFIEATLKDLRKRIKGKPPETDEERVALVKEDEQGIAQDQVKSPFGASAAGNSSSGGKKHGSGKAPTAAHPKAGAPLAQARAEYAQGRGFYVKTNPLTASQEQVQNNIHKAAPHFRNCLDWCEKARRAGASGGAIDDLEQRAAKRLYDCNKRMELRR